MENTTLIGKTQDELEELVRSAGSPSYRGRQIYRWIYVSGVRDYDEMHTIPGSLRQHLAAAGPLHPLTSHLVTGDLADGSQKFLFTLSDGKQVESVLMKEKKRLTVCVSTQVGCAVNCSFCATAAMGFHRNLTAGEIVDQVLQIQHYSGAKISNVVFMGMGEPFLNYDHVLQAADLLHDPDGMNLGNRRITISTAGIIPGIRRFTKEKRLYKLAISLNATSDEQRRDIMPLTKKYPITTLLPVVQKYYQVLRHQVTFEYVLLDRFNDTPGDARRLIRMIGRLPCKVNIIPYNEIGGNFRRPAPERMTTFLDTLRPAPFTVTVRWSKGTDIKAGCGQLATEYT
ncbi:MAG: 23S rRNA (adenine(2503)-C(2))-methyltransferase RlmN [Fidelibacterota bacterium]